VDREAYPDPTAEEGDWVAVDLVPVKALAKPVTLAALKADKSLNDMSLVKKSRLSVHPVSPEQLVRILKLAGHKS